MKQDGDIISEDARFFAPQLEILESMGFGVDLSLPLLKKFHGNVEKVVGFLLG